MRNLYLLLVEMNALTDIENSVFDVKDWFVDYLPYEVMWMDEEGSIVYANRKFCQSLGYAQSAITQLSIFDINPSVDRLKWEKHWEKVQREGIDHFKTIHKKESGDLYEVDVFSQYFSNNGKNLICAIVNDITASHFYRKLINRVEVIAHIGGWKLTIADQSLAVTKETLSLFDVDDKALLYPVKLVDFFLERDRFRQLITQAMTKSQMADEVFTTRDNRYFRCILEPVVKGGQVYEVVGIFQDITAIETKKNDLKFHKEILDNTEDLVLVYDRDGRLLYHSESVVRELGFSKEELDDATVYTLDKRVTPEWWEHHFQEIVAKKVVHFEWLLTRKNETKFPVDISANYLKYEGKELNCAVVRNITEKKERDLQLHQALEAVRSMKDRLENENEYLQEEIKHKINADNIICQSNSYLDVLSKVHQVAPTDTTVLITGESGTGKELLANALHNNSKRKEQTLIKVNCATLPKELFESELFGHKKGAFTGAVDHRIGKFTLADGGTIFLDEIGEVPIDLQPKLLRVLQEGEFDQLGGVGTQKVNARIIAATNRDLEEMVAQGTFREDLYYRLNVFPIHNIPLRERKSDIPLLAQFFMEKYTAKIGKSFKRLSKKTAALLMQYDFPGNIRELENIIERAVIIENGTTLQPGEWLPKGRTALQKTGFLPLETVQRNHIVEVLNHTNWRVSGVRGAAQILKVKDKTLFAKMKRLGIEKKVTLG